MAMNVKPIPTVDNEINEIRLGTADIINHDILPVEDKLWGAVSDSANAPNEVLEEAKQLRHEVQEKVKTIDLVTIEFRVRLAGPSGKRPSQSKSLGSKTRVANQTDQENFDTAPL